jgi:hypothetical protein
MGISISPIVKEPISSTITAFIIKPLELLLCHLKKSPTGYCPIKKGSCGCNDPQEPFTIRFPTNIRLNRSSGSRIIHRVGAFPSGYSLTVAFPSLATHVPDYSGGTATVFHRVPVC